MKKFDFHDWVVVLLIGLLVWYSSLRSHPGVFSTDPAYAIGSIFGSICFRRVLCRDLLQGGRLGIQKTDPERYRKTLISVRVSLACEVV